MVKLPSLCVHIAVTVFYVTSLSVTRDKVLVWDSKPSRLIFVTDSRWPVHRIRHRAAQHADHFAPVHEVRSRVPSHSPCFDTECRATRRACRKLERRYRRTKTDHDNDRSVFFASLQRKQAEFAAKKNGYWAEWIAEERGNLAKLWQLLSKILRRDEWWHKKTDGVIKAYRWRLHWVLWEESGVCQSEHR